MAAFIKVATRSRHLALGWLFLVATLGFAKPLKLSKDLQRQSSGQWVNVIVQYRVPPTRARLATIVAKGGGSLQQNLPVINGGAFAVKASSLAALARDPNVAYISLDRTVRATGLSTDYYDQAVFAPYAWSKNLDGSGIGIALLDSGISPHRDFSLKNSASSRIVYSQNFLVGPSTATTDYYGHGTHVAGILAGNGTDSKGQSFHRTFLGVADNANLINFRVLDQYGNGSDSEVIAAIQAAISLKSKYNIRVLNLSLGRPVYESYTVDPLCRAVEAAWKAGIVVVVAAGNGGRNNAAGTSGYGTITAPGNDPYVITVGAMKPMGTTDRSDDQIASYSSKGPTLFDHVAKPDIVAPGNMAISVLASSSSTLAKESPKNIVALSSFGSGSGPSNYFVLSGTSMAAPVVSGAAALLLQQHASLTPDQVKARLMKSAYKTFPRYSTATDPTTGKKYTSQYDIFTVGAGYLDIQAALSSADLAPATFGSAKSPSVARDKSGNVYLVTGRSILWGGSITWGTSIVWGTSVMWGTSTAGESVLWGSSAPWGSSSDNGYSVLWGTSVVWGSSDNNDPEAIPIELEGEK
jgi:serine protease AprX